MQTQIQGVIREKNKGNKVARKGKKVKGESLCSKDIKKRSIEL